MTTKFFTAAVLSLSLIGAVSSVEAAGRQRGRSSSAGSAGRAVPRGSAPYVAGSRVVVRTPYRPYYYAPRFGLSFYGYPYGYYPYGYGYSYGYGYPYGYYPGGYGYAVGGYVGSSYGGVRITDAPEDAAVYADGYYVGTVGDFNGTFQRLDLEAGPHHIEIVRQGGAPASFDVNVRPGQTVTYRAN